MSTTSPSSKVIVGLSVLVFTGCATLPGVSHRKFDFPKEDAFVGDVFRPYTKLGGVRSKVNFQSMDPSGDETDMCRNYYNKAVKDLVRMAKDRGGDAVVDVRSVVFLEDGKMETYKTPECADDGFEGQILTQGVVVKWKPREPNT